MPPLAAPESDRQTPDTAGQSEAEETARPKQPDGAAREDAFDQQGAEPLSPAENASLDQIGAGLGAVDSTSSSSSGNGSSGSGLSKVGKGIAKFAGRNKKPLIGGGGIIGLVLLLIGSLSFGPFELLHIFNVMYQHVRADITREVDKETSKVEQKLLQRSAQQAADRAAGKPITDTGADTVDGDSDGPLEAEASQVNFEAIEPDLENAGVHATYDSEGDITSLNDNGTELTENQLASDDNGQGILDQNSVLADDLNQAADVPDLDVLSYERVQMEDDAGVSYEGVLPTDDNSTENPEQLLEDDVENGASPGEIQGIGDATQAENAPTDTTPNDPTATQQANDAKLSETDNGPLGDAINTSEADFKAGLQSGEVSSDDAIAAGIAKFEADTADEDDEPTADLTTVCLVDKGVVSATTLRAYEDADLLIRHGYLLPTAVGQLHEGSITAKGLGSLMKMLQGNSSAATGSEASMSFDQSAAWRRDTGEAVTSSNPDLSPTANPAKDPKVVLGNTLNSYVSKVGGTGVCNALTSTFGMVFQGVLGVGELVLSAPEGEAPEFATVAQNAAFKAAFLGAVLPEVLKYFSGLSITGVEDAVQFFNNSDAGLTLGTADYAKSLGGSVLTSTQSTALNLETQQSIARQESHQSLAHQMLAVQDPASLASKLLDRVPPDPKAYVGSILSSIFTAPRTVFSNIGELVTPSAHADDTTSNNPYGFYQYGFTDSDIGQYDIFKNEAYLRHTMVSLPSGQASLIAVLGDPTTYQESPSGDPNTSDLLHCFVNSPQSFETNPASAKYCGDIGQLIPLTAPSGDSANSPQGPTMQDLQDIACSYHGGQPGPGCNPIIPADTLTRYRQYILDSRIMTNLVSFTNAG